MLGCVKPFVVSVPYPRGDKGEAVPRSNTGQCIEVRCIISLDGMTSSHSSDCTRGLVGAAWYNELAVAS